MIRFRHFSLPVLLGIVALAPTPAIAAQSYDGCGGFIDSVPATITTQGVWCLRKDLATSINSGSAITIATNNVTIDCNDFKLGGLAAGNGSQADGISLDSRHNATVRNCNIRGFRNGVALAGGSGNVVEDNRLDNNLQRGIWVSGANSMVRRNRVYDTGGPGLVTHGIGVHDADVIDNTVSGVVPLVGGAAMTFGIYMGAQARNNVIRGNRISDVMRHEVGTQGPSAIMVVSPSYIRIADNHVAIHPADNSGYGIRGGGDASSLCSGNTVRGYRFPMQSCRDSGGNDAL